MTRPPLRIEILSFADCPNATTTRGRVRQAVEAEALPANVVEVLVEIPEAAQALRFLGSPSVRVNGRDVEPGADARSAYGLMCRTYPAGSGSEGAPSLSLIRNAIRSSVADCEGHVFGHVDVDRGVALDAVLRDLRD
jgi:hypothetical protein